MSTNLKPILKPSVQDVCQNLDSGRQYTVTVVSTPCRQISAKIEFRQTGWLARGRVSEKLPLELRAGPPLGANLKASRRKSLARFKNGPLLKV